MSCCGGEQVQVDTVAPYKDQPADEMSPYTQGPFSTINGTVALPIQYAKAGIASKEVTPARTIIDMFKSVADKHGDRPALRVERPVPPLNGKEWPPALPMEEWKCWTYKEYYNDVVKAAKSLLKIGVQQHDAVNIFGFNSPEWFVGEMCAIFVGAKAAGIYPSDTAEQVSFKCRHSGASVAFVEDASKLKKFQKAAQDSTRLRAVVSWACDPIEIKGADGKDIPCYSWEQFMALGDDVKDEELEERIAKVEPGHCCGLIYTSGTTGAPKAVMISHDNVIFEVNVVLGDLQHIYNVAQEERILSYLPLSHVAGMMIDMVMPLLFTEKTPGWWVAHFARPYDLKVGAIGDRLRLVQPTLFLGVPRVWEKVAEKVKAIGAAKPACIRSLSGWCKGKLLAHQMNCQLGGDGSKKCCHCLAAKILGAVKTALGLNQCRYGFTGAAPITKDTLEYFGSLGININEVYGMSECTGATTWSIDSAHVWGSCGFKMNSSEVKIFKVNPETGDKKECPLADNLFESTEEEQGEICFRGRHIMSGYLANPDLGIDHVQEIQRKTDAAIDAEGWLHSGDKGTMDKRGMVKITGRYKELIIGAGGENIAPVPIENSIKRLCPALSNVLMIGDQRKYNVALITLKAKGATGELPGGNDLDGPALKVNESVTTISGACKDNTYIQAITDAITATNSDGSCCPSNAAKVQKFTILPADFSVVGGELTPTFKTKRSVVRKKYKTVLDMMYAPEAKTKNYIPFPVSEDMDDSKEAKEAGKIVDL